MSQNANDSGIEVGDMSQRHDVHLSDGSTYTVPADPGAPIAEPVDWAELTHGFLGNMPHPLAPSIKVKDYPTAARLAAATAHSSSISPPVVEAFWKEFNALNQGLGDRAMSPEQYTQTLQKIAPLSYVYHGRSPTMTEIGQMHDAAPDKVRGYYYNLPDQNYPDVPAGDMVKALQSAKPFARMFLGRDPLKNEARFLYHSGKDPMDHYQLLGQLESASPEPTTIAGGIQQLTPRAPGSVPITGIPWGQPRPQIGAGGLGVLGRVGTKPPASGEGRTPTPPPPQSGGQGEGLTE